MATDLIASFPLRGASKEELAKSLEQSHFAFADLRSLAEFMLDFPQLAVSSGVGTILANETIEAFRLADRMGFIIRSENAAPQSEFEKNIRDVVLSVQMPRVQHGTRTASIVLAHSALDKLLWRLCRFGFVANRASALDYAGRKQITVSELVSAGFDASLDNRLEACLSDLAEKSIVLKWDCLCSLIGLPTPNDEVRYDRTMLSSFNDVRNDAAHHGGETLETINLKDHLSRMNWFMLGWTARMAARLDIQLDAAALFGVPSSAPDP